MRLLFFFKISSDSRWHTKTLPLVSLLSPFPCKSPIVQLKRPLLNKWLFTNSFYLFINISSRLQFTYFCLLPKNPPQWRKAKNYRYMPANNRYKFITQQQTSIHILTAHPSRHWLALSPSSCSVVSVTVTVTVFCFFVFFIIPKNPPTCKNVQTF